MGILKQWLSWIAFLGIVPVVAFLPFAGHMRQHEAAYYACSVPPLLLYFCILGWLGLDVPGTVSAGTPEDRANALGFRTVRRLIGWILAWAQGLVVYVGFPWLGTALIYYAVRDGEIIGYFLGPAMVWVSGGLWVLTVQYLVRRRREVGTVGRH